MLAVENDVLIVIIDRLILGAVSAVIFEQMGQHRRAAHGIDGNNIYQVAEIIIDYLHNLAPYSAETVDTDFN